MGYFAQIDKNGIVTRVIVADQKFIDSGRVGEPSEWVETSMDGSLRKNYAGIGYTYNKKLDGFIAPQPYKSWVLDEKTCQYVPPVPMPTDQKLYTWDEATLEWLEKPAITDSL